MNVRICTKHCFFRVNRASAAEKVGSRAPGCGRRRFSVESSLDCARSGTEGSRRLILFFDDVLLCFACVETLFALELLHSKDVVYSIVL